MGRKFPVWPSDQRRRANRGARYEGGELKKLTPPPPVCGEFNDDGDPCTKESGHKGKC